MPASWYPMAGILSEPLFVTNALLPDSANLDFLRFLWPPFGIIRSPLAHWIKDLWNFLTGHLIFNLVPLKTDAWPPTFNLTVFCFKLCCSYIWFTFALIMGVGSSANKKEFQSKLTLEHSITFNAGSRLLYMENHEWSNHGFWTANTLLTLDSRIVRE